MKIYTLMYTDGTQTFAGIAYTSREEAEKAFEFVKRLERKSWPYSEWVTGISEHDVYDTFVPWMTEEEIENIGKDEYLPDYDPLVDENSELIDEIQLRDLEYTANEEYEQSFSTL